MKRRPTSVTVIAWIVIVISVLALVGAVTMRNDPATLEAMAQSPLPVWAQQVQTYGVILVTLLCAAFMLRGANWARLLYIGWNAVWLTVALILGPERLLVLPAVVLYFLFVFFLTRPKARAYFTAAG
jgi:hypothetical protein